MTPSEYHQLLSEAVIPVSQKLSRQNGIAEVKALVEGVTSFVVRVYASTIASGVHTQDDLVKLVGREMVAVEPQIAGLAPLVALHKVVNELVKEDSNDT